MDDRGKIAKHVVMTIAVSLLLSLAIRYSYPYLYPYFVVPYWHLVNENPIRFDDREFEVPRDWVAIKERGDLLIYIPPFPWEPSSTLVSINRLNEKLYGPSDQTDEEIAIDLQRKIEVMEGEGYHEFEPIEVPLPGVRSRCAVGKSVEEPPLLLVECMASGQIFYYFFDGPSHYLPLFIEIVTKAEKVGPETSREPATT